MENQRSHGSDADQMSEPPIRSRWAPKPEQIVILESIFNSGMVNPPKDDTVRIRRQLEKFGPVGDANVFYWFQNRRSRSRRRQRQLQASLSAEQPQPQPQPQPPPHAGGGGIDQYGNSAISCGGFWGGGSSSSFGTDHYATCDQSLSFSGHQEVDQNSIFGPNNSSNLQNYQSAEVITVFINGVATEVRKGTLMDVKDMFGGDFLLFHSSGMPVDQVTEHGFLVHHGESYFLVPKDS